MAVVAFAGSRSLPFDRHTVEEVSRVVAAVVAAGRTIAVGCSVGADAAVLSCRLALPFPESTSGSALRVFAVGGKEGEKMTGFWSGSAPGPRDGLRRRRRAKLQVSYLVDPVPQRPFSG